MKSSGLLAREGDVIEVETLLSRGGDVNYHNEDSLVSCVSLW